MYDYDTKDVAKTLKRCIKKFLEEDDADPEVSYKMSKFSNWDEDDDEADLDDYPVNVKKSASALSVVRKKKSNSIVDSYY
jgi:hypothetical protein